MTLRKPEANDDELARAALSAGRDQALRDHASMGGLSPAQLWALAQRRRVWSRAVGGTAATIVAVVAIPLAWSSIGPGTPSDPEPGLGRLTPAHTGNVPTDTSPDDPYIPTVGPDGQPYDHERTMASIRMNDVHQELLSSDAYAGLSLSPDGANAVVHWVGEVPDAVRDRALQLANPTPITFDTTAAHSLSSIQAALGSVKLETWLDLEIVSMAPDAANGTIMVEALPDSPLHNTDNPGTLLGFPKSIDVSVTKISPEERDEPPAIFP